MTAPLRKLRLAYLVTHPIQYQAPLLRLVAAQPDIDLTVFFGTDFSVRAFTAGEFGREITWDVPLLEGYKHELLPQLFAPPPGQQPPLDFWRPLNYGLARRLTGRFDALWVHGYAHWLHWTSMAAAQRRGIKVLLRDEATSISAARSPLKQAAKRAFFGGLNRMVDAFLSIGTLNRRYYRENGIPENRLFDMPYAVDNTHFRRGAEAASATRETTRAGLGLEPGRPVLLFAAKLIERKRPALLLEAFARLHNDAALRRPYLLFAGDGPLRAALEMQAKRLRERFEDAFWCDDIGTYALALDGRKAPCRVRTSNAGHLLFTEIASPERAARVAAQLLEPEFFSGWGIRTVGANEPRYNPMSYHNGSVWPHDNALIALGMARYGLTYQVERLFTALFEMAAYMDQRRLPELFCGFPRMQGRGPTMYPVACAPQAWAAATPFALLQACFGMEFNPRAHEVRFRHPHLPAFLDEALIRGLRVGASRFDVVLHRYGSTVSLNVLEKSGPVTVSVTV